MTAGVTYSVVKNSKLLFCVNSNLSNLCPLFVTYASLNALLAVAMLNLLILIIDVKSYFWIVFRLSWK